MLHKSQKASSSSSRFKVDRKSNMIALWQRGEFLRICSEENLVEKTQAIGVTIPVNKKSGDTVGDTA